MTSLTLFSLGDARMKDYRLAPFVSQEEIEQRLDALASQINRDYSGKELVIIGILKGAFIFLADLTRRLTMPVEIDFVRLASYGSNSKTSGEVKITKNIEVDINGRDVLIVEDIIDTGVTLSWFMDYIATLHPKSARMCVLVEKNERRQVNIEVDYVGIRIEKGFIVGYGLDYSERHRNLPGIYEVQFID